MEGSNNCTPPNCPTKTLDLTKFPNGWGEVLFWAYPYPPIMSDKKLTLYWSGPEGATYTIRYSIDGQPVKVPHTGKPPLANSGQYPETNDPALKLKQSTTFYLTVEKTIDNKLYQAHKYVPVTVVVIPPPPPQITLFSAKPNVIKENGKNTLVTLSWKANHTNQLEVQGLYEGRVYYDDQARQWSTSFWVTHTQNFVATAWGLPGYTGPPTLQQTAVYSPPQILKFTGEIQTASSSEISLVLNWEVRYVTECKISGISETPLPPIGPITITPSVEHPLQTTYTLTATNVAGSATSELTVVWGKQALTTTTTVNTPSGVAVFPDGTLVFVVNSGNNTVSVFDAATLQPAGKQTVAGPIKVQKSPAGIAISSHVAGWPYGSRVFIPNNESKSLSVLLTAQTDPPKIRRYANATAVGTSPMGVAVSPDGSRVFVANYGDNTLSVLDVETLLPVKGTPLPVGQNPTRVAVLPDGSRVFVTNFFGNTVSVFDATADPIKIIGKPIPVGTHPAGLAVSPDGSRVFVANNGDKTISVLDATSDPITVIGKPITVGAGPKSLAITPDGARLFVTGTANTTITVLDTTTDPISVVKPSIKVGAGGYFSSVAISPDGAHLFVGNRPYGSVSMVIPTSITGGKGT